MENSKFVIELNKVSSVTCAGVPEIFNCFCCFSLSQSLNVKHLGTFINKDGVADPKILERPSCYLNFDNDRVEFEFIVADHRWQKMSMLKTSVTFEKVDTATYKKQVREVPSKRTEQVEDSNYKTVSIKAGFKDILLGIFSPHNKEFRLTVDYKLDLDLHKTVFFVIVPSIDQK